MITKARFYKLGTSDQLVCRLYLDLKRADSSEKASPDLIIVMLNPGSCSPKTENYDEETDVNLDQTLRRVAKLFLKIPTLDWIRVLNLSDLTNPKSGDFFKKLEELENSNISHHSIFDKSREFDFFKLVPENSIVYLACGTNTKSQSLLEKAIERLNERKAQIVNEAKNKFYHPLVRPINNISEWTEQVSQYYGQQRHL